MMLTVFVLLAYGMIIYFTFRPLSVTMRLALCGATENAGVEKVARSDTGGKRGSGKRGTR